MPISTNPIERQRMAEEPGLLDFLVIVWRNRWLVLSTTILFACLAAAATVLVPPRYDATVLLSPNTSGSGGSGLGQIGSMLSQLGASGLSIGGLTLSENSGEKAIATATLQSRELTEQYIQDNNLLPVLFPKEWDKARGKWRASDPSKIPTLWKASEYFADHVRKVDENGKTGLVTLTVQWRDPTLAAKWANGLVLLTNDYLRNKAITESERDIAYLRSQAAVTNEIGLKTDIYALMESEIQREMLARGSNEYALKVVDPAFAPGNKSFPRPALWIGAGVFLGFVLGLAATAMKVAVYRSREVRSPTVGIAPQSGISAGSNIDGSQMQSLVMRHEAPR